jgi:hypothetical protein
MQFRLKPVTAALMFAVMGGLSINAQAVEVAAGALDAALRVLASESGIQILFDANELKGAKTSGVRNAASPEDALRKVLEGSGYSFQSTGNKSFVIRKNHLSKDSVMDPIVVAATRTEERLSRVAASINVASREEFQEQQATAVGDVLKKNAECQFRRRTAHRWRNSDHTRLSGRIDHLAGRRGQTQRYDQRCQQPVAHIFVYRALFSEEG